MKTSTTSRRLISILALLLVIVMCFSACGGNEEVNSGALNDSGTVSDSTEVDDIADSGDSSEQENASTTSTGKTSSTVGNNGGNKTNTTTKTGKTTWDADYLSKMPASVKQKGITILYWRYLLPSEKKLINDFEKKTGCKVTVVETTEPEYSTKLISLIAGKDSPDVINLGANAFPSRVAKAMQPLDSEIFRLDDAIWDKSQMNNFTVNGNYYGVATHKIWNCTDTHFVTFYQPKMLASCGVETMPYDLWKQGKWNWAAQLDIAQKVSRANKGYTGISMQHIDLMMLSAGTDLVKYDGKNTFTNMVKKDTSLLNQAWRETCKLYEQKLVTDWQLVQVKNGQVGLFTTIAYGMWNEADWDFKSLPGGAESVHCVPVAGPTQSTAYVPYRAKTWGIAKGAKNVEGAAYFLRYFLDEKNIDFKSSFLNSQCKEVFDIITKKTTKKQPRTGYGAVNFVSANTYEQILISLSSSTSANVPTVLNAYSGKIDASLNRVNKEIKNIK